MYQASCTVLTYAQIGETFQKLVDQVMKKDGNKTAYIPGTGDDDRQNGRIELGKQPPPGAEGQSDSNCAC